MFDAARLGGPPGSVLCFESSAMDRFLGQPRRSAHQVGLSDLLDMARLAGHLPHRRALVGIEPERVNWSEAPEHAARAALELLERWGLSGDAG